MERRVIYRHVQRLIDASHKILLEAGDKTLKERLVDILYYFL